MLFGDTLANGADHLGPVLISQAFHFRNHDQFFVAFDHDRKGCRSTSAQPRIGSLDGHFDILWITIDTANDD
jgi:hypothetical protein